MKVLLCGKNVEIVSKHMEVEFFKYTCPYCGAEQEEIEFSVRDDKLFCSECNKYIKLLWE